MLALKSLTSLGDPLIISEKNESTQSLKMMFNEDNHNGHMCNLGDTNIDQVEVT